AINDYGLIVGAYVDSSGDQHGFIDDHGRFRTFDPPGSSSTFPTSVNNSGAIVGTYSDASGVAHGFLYEYGRFTKIDAPGAGSTPGQGTSVEGISSCGVIAGDIVTAGGESGWLLSNGRFSSLNDPNAAPGASPVQHKLE